MQLDWHECRKPDLACAINTVPLDGWVCFPQAEWIYRVQCVLQKAGSETWGGATVTATAAPCPEPALNYLKGQTGVVSLCIWEGMSWTWDRKFFHLHSIRICPNFSGVPLHLRFLRSLYGSIHFCDTRVKWSLTIYCPLEKITQTQPKQRWAFGINLVWTGTAKVEK